MKKFARLFVALMMVCIMAIGVAAAEITVGIVNNPPSESGYREANVKDFEAVFSAENGYAAKTFYSLKNDEQLSAAQQFITDGVDYLLISAAETTGWDAVLASAQENGIPVFLFDRMIDCDEELYAAAVVSDMANQGKLAVEWLIAQALPEYKIIHIQGAMGSDAQIGRTGALDKQVAENENWSIVVQQTAPGMKPKRRRSSRPSSTPRKTSTSSMPRTTAWPAALWLRWMKPALPMAWAARSS